MIDINDWRSHAPGECHPPGWEARRRHIQKAIIADMVQEAKAMASQVRAKFQVISVKRSMAADGSLADAEEVELSPVYGHDGSENAQWSKYTPSGQLRMYITAEGAVGTFRPGQQWYLDFTLASVPEAAQS